MKRMVTSRCLNELRVSMKRIAISRCLNELSNNEAYSGLEIS